MELEKIKTLNFVITQKEHEALTKIKEKEDLTWRELIVKPYLRK